MTTPQQVRSRRHVALGFLGVLAAIGVSLQLAPFPAAGRAAAFDQPSGDAEAVVETDPVLETGDAADDAAIWYDEADPARSVVVGNDKKGSLEVYDLAGHRIQRISGGFYGNVDIRRGFTTGAGAVDLVVAWHGGIQVNSIDPTTRQLTNITDTTTGRIAVPTGGEGLCLYRSPVDGSTYAFAVARNGHVAQYQLTDVDGDGRIEGTLRRDWWVGSESEGCVADDELGFFYISEENVGIWKYSAEPDSSSSPSARTLVDSTVSRGGHILPDAEGLTIVYQPGGTGYLMASSQAASDELNSFMVYERQGANAFIRSFKVVAGSATDGCGRTDGIDALAMDMGPTFPHGLFVCQDNTNNDPAAGNQNFKFVPLERVVGLDTGEPPPTTTSSTSLPDDTSTTTTTSVPDSTTSTSTTSTSTTSTTSTSTSTTSSTTSTTVPPVAGTISFVGQATANVNTRTHAVTIPSGVRAGDGLMLFLSTNNLATVAAPTGVTGWTQVGAVATSSARSVVWRKVAVAADAGKVVRVTLSAMAKANFVVAVYRGTSPVNPVAAFAGGPAANGTSHATPVVNVTRSGTWAISYWMHKDSSTTTLTPPSGVVVRSNSTQTGSGRVVGLVADSASVITATSYGGLIARAAASASNAHAWTIILAPA